MHLALRDVIHHGVEAAAFIGVGTLAATSFSNACIAYGTGKVSYLVTRKFLDTSVPEMSKSVKRKISWGGKFTCGRQYSIQRCR